MGTTHTFYPKPAMSMEAQLSPTEHALFASSLRQFEGLRIWLCAAEQGNAYHDDIETRVLLEVRELGRLLVQAHMDLRTERERHLPEPLTVDRRAYPRLLARNLDTVLGTVRVGRIAWQIAGDETVIPLDRALRMPAQRYSFGAQRFVAEQAETMSYDRTGISLHAMGIEVPKRQREQIVVRMAQDFEAFYAERPRPANDVAGLRTLLVMSVDSVGVRVVPSSLREDTRKAAEEAAAAFVAAGSVRGDPMAPRVGHTHDRRMAVVTMNWDQEPQPREAADILEQFKPKAERTREEIVPGRLYNRRVRGTLEHTQGEAITEMFAEAQRRDPKHERVWVVLLDGSSSQREQVLAEANKLGVHVELVLDLMHGLHYLWVAGAALHGGTTEAADAWVRQYVERLLTRPIAFVVSGLRQIASQRKTSPKARAALRKCASYFENNTVAMDYANALVAGFPIATGNVEGACRHLVRDRMDITGARWTTQGAEAMIRVRALMKSGDWDEYCRFHFRKEHDRTYPVVQKVA